MVDKLTPAQRRKSMQGNKSTGTQIEIILGKAMFAAGLRYRKNNKQVFGTPDFTFKKYKIAVFADGDFWHGKDWEERRKKLGKNAGFWFEKIERNLERDFKVNQKLREEGWIVLRFWESDIRKDIDAIVDVILFNYHKAKEEFENQKWSRKKVWIEKYLSQKENSNDFLKNRAISYTQEFLKSKYPEEDVPIKVAEETLKYGAPPQ